MTSESTHSTQDHPWHPRQFMAFTIVHGIEDHPWHPGWYVASKRICGTQDSPWHSRHGTQELPRHSGPSVAPKAVHSI